ncbi:MAG TPA: TetR/AcrR family transcriptional regulator [Kribbellaceae bacterium]|nr:TetR/AcrR family transcriptional regulator [Kribbellaceae bacterium]
MATTPTPATAARRRLSPEQRRDQLLAIGSKLFAERPYDEVWIEEVAELAGVSRGLLYHYFPTKRDFFAAIVERSVAHMLRATEISPDLPMAEQVAAGLDAYIAFFLEHPYAMLAVNRGALAGDAQVQCAIRREMTILQERIVDALGLTGDKRKLATLAVHSWLAFTRAACVEWVQNRTVSKEELRTLCMRSLSGALAPVAQLDALPAKA